MGLFALPLAASSNKLHDGSIQCQPIFQAHSCSMQSMLVVMLKLNCSFRHSLHTCCGRQLHDRSAGWWCLQGLSKLMTDLVTRYWQGGLDGDPSAYCHIGLPDLNLDHQRLLLLHLATTTPTGAQDWRYFGKHAVPLVLQSWVKLANYWMKHKHAGSQKDILITNMQMHIPALCESWETEASFCMHVLLPALCRPLCESHCSCKQTADMLACMLCWMLFTEQCEVCDAWQASDLILHLAH